MTAPVMTDTETKAAVLELKASPSGEFEIRFATKRDAAGNPVVDHDGDVYADGAIGTQNVLVGCWNHGDACPGPAGTATTYETNKDIRAKGRLLVETAHGKDEFARWQALGKLAEFSFQFRVLDHDYINVGNRTVRRLKSLEVISVDLVARGAGIDTGIVSLKSAACGCPVKAELLALRAEAEGILASIALPAKEQAVKAELLAEKARYEALVEPYPEVAASEVQPLVRAAAKSGIAAAAARLDIPVPAVRWYRVGLMGKATRAGFVYPLDGQPPVVNLRANISPELAYEAACHEVAHLAGADEDQALTFGGWMLDEARASWRGLY